LKLSIGTPFYQEKLWSTSVDVVVVLKRTFKNYEKQSYHLKRDFLWNSLSNPECPGSSPEYPDRVSGVSGRVPGVSELLLLVRKTLWSGVSRPKCPEYPDIYPEYPGTLLPTASFCERGYKYPHTPSFTSLLLIFDQNCLLAKESPLTSHLLNSWVIFLGDWSEIVARAKICASKSRFHLLSTSSKSSRWILVCYSWSFKLLDG
jgi:hypothetical protein